MAVIDPGPFAVMRLFPGEKERVRLIYLQSQSFRTLCRDYRKSERVLAYWQNSEHERAREICQEYQVLKDSLEKEIKDYLQRGSIKSMHKSTK